MRHPGNDCVQMLSGLQHKLSDHTTFIGPHPWASNRLPKFFTNGETSSRDVDPVYAYDMTWAYTLSTKNPPSNSLLVQMLHRGVIDFRNLSIDRSHFGCYNALSMCITYQIYRFQEINRKVPILQFLESRLLAKAYQKMRTAVQNTVPYGFAAMHLPSG